MDHNINSFEIKDNNRTQYSHLLTTTIFLETCIEFPLSDDGVISAFYHFFMGTLLSIHPAINFGRVLLA